MASRLSSDSSGQSGDSRVDPVAISSLAAADHGLANFAWQTDNLPTPVQEERSSRALLENILASTDPAGEIQALEPSFIRHIMLGAGIEDYLDVLPLLSRDQMTHIMDFEGWDSANRISLAGTMRWLQLHKQAQPGELFRRFKELEGEFQMAVLGPEIETWDLEAYEAMSQEEQDSLSRLPCGEVFYKIKTQDPESRQFIEELVNQALAKDIEYAYSMLAHASYLPPNEQEDLASRFRLARLEEEGFVTASDSARLFLAAGGEEAIQRWTGMTITALTDHLFATTSPAAADACEQALATTPAGKDKRQPAMTIEQALAAIDRADAAGMAGSLSRLANTLAVAAGVEGDNLPGLRRVLAHTKGYCNLGLELLAADPQDLVDISKAAKIVATGHPAILFKASVAVFDEARRRTIDMLEASGLIDCETAQQLRRLLFTRKFGLMMSLLDLKVLPVAGFEATEVLKGLFNRFPLCPVTTNSGDQGRPDSSRMTFKPVYDKSSLLELLRWVRQLRNIAPVTH